MPKTYNARMIEGLEREAQYAPPLPETPDVIRFIRHFPPEEIASIADRMEQRVAAGKLSTMKPDTAYLAVQALREFNAKPKRHDIVREICRMPGGCGRRQQCVECISKANAVMQLYQGQKVR